MKVSVFDLFKIGIGPSSSHTVGPMIAAKYFLDSLMNLGLLGDINTISISLYGSLGATGKGHGSGKAVILGLSGEAPDKVDVNQIPKIISSVIDTKKINLFGNHQISFDYHEDIIFHRKKSLPYHSNGMKFSSYDSKNKKILERIYYSVGGGFVLNDEEMIIPSILKDTEKSPFEFKNGEELLSLCKKNNLSISEIMMLNEKVRFTEKEIRLKLLNIWSVMQESVTKGCNNKGILPGGLKVKRRAADLYKKLKNNNKDTELSLSSMDWVNVYALAVNEENAAGGRVVTAPTNGAAGIIPALLHYYTQFCSSYKRDGEDGIIRFLLTAAAIGIIIKQNASISGAEVGCQGEIGSACAMAAAGLTEVLGGSPKKILNAAEIGIEHNLGLTCDPIGGLVQVPCIERNAMGSIKAINASRLALRGNGEHFVSLDKAILTMRETGKDMLDKYKETSRGGLATQVIEVPVNIVEC